MKAQSYWARQEGDSHAHWSDAHLTPLGEQQAREVHEFWKQGLVEAKFPAPQSYYTSPFYRCLQTSQISFTELDLPEDRPFKPIVKEVSFAFHFVYSTTMDVWMNGLG